MPSVIGATSRLTAMVRLTALNNDELLIQFREEVDRDNKCNAELLRLIDEVDRRQLWAELAHPSMFDFCVVRFRMSESVAGQRIGVARLARRFPTILEMVERGEIHLTGLLRLKAHLTEENHRQVLAEAKHRSVRDIERLVARIAPQPDTPSLVRAFPGRANVTSMSMRRPERSSTSDASCPLLVGLETAAPVDRRAADPTPVAPGRYRLHVTIDEETHSQLAQLQDLLAHQIPNGDPAAIVKRAFGALQEQLLKKKAALTDRPRRSAPKTTNRTRSIPAAIRREIWKRDEGRCGFVGTDGSRCTATRALEYAHVRAWAKGGEHSVENLGLRCRGHNDYEANRDYGVELMARKKRRSTGVREGLATYQPIRLRFSTTPIERAPPRRTTGSSVGRSETFAVKPGG